MHILMVFFLILKRKYLPPIQMIQPQKWRKYFLPTGEPRLRQNVSENDWTPCWDNNGLTDHFFEKLLPAKLSYIDEELDWSHFKKFIHPKRGRLTPEQLAHDFIDHGEDDRIKIYTKLLKKYDKKVNKQKAEAETTQCITKQA